MKRLSLLLFFGCLLSISTLAANPVNPTSNDYFLDDQKVEQLFASSVDISLTASSAAMISEKSSQNGMAGANAFYAPGDKNFATALLLNFFLGALGIHRLYLGTKTMTWIGYILTCGGIFGIVPLIDFIVLIVNNDDISPFVDNPKFFMWSGNM
jgi:TM2 domain-containing membrane protein YozV